MCETNMLQNGVLDALKSKRKVHEPECHQFEQTGSVICEEGCVCFTCTIHFNFPVSREKSRYCEQETPGQAFKDFITF